MRGFCAFAMLMVATILATLPASADGRYVNGRGGYGYRAAPLPYGPSGGGNFVYGYSDVPAGYALSGTFAPGAPPSLWRQRRQAYDAIFTKEKRVVYDSDYAAEFRQASRYYAPPVAYAYGPAPRMQVYYWRKPNRYGPDRIIAPAPAAPPVQYFAPVAAECRTFQYWDGAQCIDARYYSPYQNPFKYLFNLN